MESAFLYELASLLRVFVIFVIFVVIDAASYPDAAESSRVRVLE